MTEFCQVCNAYENQQDFKTLSCGCKFCKLSISRWVIAQLENYYRVDCIIICPLGVLGHNLSEDDIRECLKPDQYTLYETIKLKKDLLSYSCYKQCPMSNCNYIGWVDYSKKCTRDLICENCKETWIEPSLYPLFFRITRHWEMIWKGTDDFWNQIWKEMWAKFCPKCDSPIEKNGGCYHMTCQNCSYQFCWDCLQPYNGHLTSLCKISIGYTSILLFMMIIGVFLRLSSMSDVFYSIQIFIVWRFLILLIGCLHIWLFIGTFFIIYDYKRGYITSDKRCLVASLIFFSGVGLVLIYYFFDIFWTFIELISYILISAGFNLPAAVILYRRAPGQ